MLVLSRKQKEAVVDGEVEGFGRLLKITVLEINQGGVKLGFEAADEVPIHRSEIRERIQGGDLPGRSSRDLETSGVC